MTPTSTDRPRLRSGSVELEVAPAEGGRVSGLTVDGWDVLVREARTVIDWGSYAMVPWAGRLRDGILRWRGREWQFPLTSPPNAIHGTLLWQPWRVIGGADGGSELVLGADLAEPWPFGGRAVQLLRLTPDQLSMTLEVHATREPMPVIVGWHPWFRRRLRRADGHESEPLAIDLHAGAMLEADPPGIPTGRRVPVPPGPWDDTFVDLWADPVVRWPGALEVSVASPAATHWVVFTGETFGVCVEPQTGPPNGLNGGDLGAPAVVEPGTALVATASISWRSAA